MTEPIEPAGRSRARKPGDAERSCDPLREGDTVTVYQLAITRRPFIEGMATILGTYDEARDLYWVRFAGETVPRLRRVHAGPWQSEPDAMLRALLAHWRHAYGLETQPLVLSDDGLHPGEGQ